jgi:Protein ENHANCED DISEASE RESISTANCE 2, C-terminal/START domain
LEIGTLSDEEHQDQDTVGHLMRMEMDMSSAGDVSVSGNGSESILEGTMLKRSSHHYWHERYLVFSADNTLSYYHKKGADRARRSYSISREAGCEVGSLFVSQRPNKDGKELIYCFKLTWNNAESRSHESILNESYIVRDDGSSVGTEVDTRKVLGEPGHNFDAAEKALDDDIDFLFENYGAEEKDRFDSPVLKGALPLIEEREHSHRSGDLSLECNNILHASNDNRVSNQNSSSNMPTAKKKIKKSLLPNPGKAFKNMSSKKSVKGETESPADGICPRPEDDPNKSNISLNYTGDSMDVSLKRAERVQRLYAEKKMKERDKLRKQYMSDKKANRKKQQKLLLHGTKVAVAASAAAGVAILTAGVGLVAGLVFVGIGAAAGASSTTSALGLPKRGKRPEIVIATPSYEEAKLWKSTLDAHLEYENLKETTWGRILFEGGKVNNAFIARELGSTSFEDLNDRRGGDTPFLFEPSTQWTPLDGLVLSLLGAGNQGLRIFREEKSHEYLEAQQSRSVHRMFTNLSVDGGKCAPLKSHIVLNTSPLDAFMCIMSCARILPNGAENSFGPRSEQAASFRVVEKIDDHMDIVHLTFRPLYLFPSWTCPRDFVMVRYWRFEPDGSFVICYESVQHRYCPPVDGYVRGEMHQAYTISPTKAALNSRAGANLDSQSQECLLTAVVQVDPRGWVPISPFPSVSFRSYGDAFGVSALLQLLDIRDAIDRDRFLAVSLDVEPPTSYYSQLKINDLPVSEEEELSLKASSTRRASGDGERNYDFSYAARESSKVHDSPSGLSSTPPPCDLEKWAEPDANSFLVRGPTYKKDQVKINAGQSIARLITMDIVEVETPLYTGLTKHPSERVQLALRKEKYLKAKGLPSDVPPFIFAVNIVLPGEPLYHAVFYFGVDDMSEIDGTSGTPSSKLCNEFFFGDSDDFRDKTFKLIPQIVQGNFMVRKAVGSTPAIMGKKLRQLYVKDEIDKRFFEIVLDCCSSSVAAGVIRLSLGYAKTLVVDMGFLFEGNSPDVLPERIFGSVRCKHPVFHNIRPVAPPAPNAF